MFQSIPNSGESSKVLLATSNPGKLRELMAGLSSLNWELVLPDTAALGAIENGQSFEDNALIKAAYASSHSGIPALSDDSGLEVDALGGEPGVFSARYGGKNTDLERNVYLLERLRGVPLAQRTARFVTVLALAYPSGQVELYRGSVEGIVLEGPRGRQGFGYDPIFYVPEAQKTFGEMTLTEKRRYSHRMRALNALLAAQSQMSVGNLITE